MPSVAEGWRSVQCIECGIYFCVTSEFLDLVLSPHHRKKMYCPNGHVMVRRDHAPTIDHEKVAAAWEREAQALLTENNSLRASAGKPPRFFEKLFRR